MGQVAYIMPDKVNRDDKNKDSQRKSDNSHELKLLQLIAKQDRTAFHQIFSLYYPRLQRFISRLSNNNELVEEIINDVLFVVWQKAGEFQNRSRVSSWIFGIAYNKAQNSISQQLKHTANRIDVIPEITDLQTPFSDLAQQQDLLQIQNALTQLSIEHQTVVILTYIYGYSYFEISEVMACPVNTVKTRMFHARKKLHELLPHSDLHFELESY